MNLNISSEHIYITVIKWTKPFGLKNDEITDKTLWVNVHVWSIQFDYFKMIVSFRHS